MNNQQQTSDADYRASMAMEGPGRAGVRERKRIGKESFLPFLGR